MNGQQGTPGYPISVKGVVVRAGRVLLLKNERDEWELPGGRLEAGETSSTGSAQTWARVVQ